MQYSVMSERINELMHKDETLRAQLLTKGELFKGYHQEMEAVHVSNAESLEGIITQIGFPSIEKVGIESNQNAWKIAQHAISLPIFMRSYLKLLSSEIDNNLIYKRQYAYLYDRISVLEDRPQHYGTQFDWDENNALSPSLFDDLSKVNKRRKILGWLTLSEQTKRMRENALEENHTPPENFLNRQKEMNEWRKKVGWLD